MDGGFHWSEISWERVKESVERKVVLGERLMMVMYRFAPNQVWPEEAHEAEQGGYILKGRIELTLPARGEKHLLGAGDGYLIPSQVPHSWRVLEETTLIDFFSPPRQELYQKKFAPHAKEG
jgi:quercetin dioxygenase-like cupin family protein